jgi:hypothetical protein
MCTDARPHFTHNRTCPLESPQSALCLTPAWLCGLDCSTHCCCCCCCFLTPCRVAEAAGLNLLRFILDNLDAITDLDKPLGGKQLLLCNPKSPRITTGAAAAVTTRLVSSSSYFDACYNMQASKTDCMYQQLP